MNKSFAFKCKWTCIASKLSESYSSIVLVEPTPTIAFVDWFFIKPIDVDASPTTLPLNVSLINLTS